MTNRIEDINGYYEVKDNPISKVGVFAYSGESIGGDAGKVYQVYRPEAELSSKECIDSFKLVPIIDEHTMLGSSDDGLTPAEKKGVHGTTGEDVYFKDGVLYANLKIFSDELQDTIDSTKKDISLGYRCVYEFVSGIFNGTKYDAIQKTLRGNHLAIVTEGRMGSEVAVLDAADSIKFTIDSKEFIKMASPKQIKEFNKTLSEAKSYIAKAQMSLGLNAEEGKEAAPSMSMEEFAAHVRTLIDFMDKLAPIESTEPGEEEVTADADGEEEAKDGENPFEKEGEEKAKDADGEEEEAKDADEEEKKEAGMDAAMVRKMIADSHKEIARGMSGKNKLAESLSALIGSFDHSEMLTKSDVAKYAAPKLGLKPVKGQELSAVEGFLAAKPNTRTFSVVTQDGKKATAKVSKIQQFING